MTRFEPAATVVMARHLGNLVKGTDQGSVEGAWNVMWKELRVRGHTRGIGVEALSGIEMSLYDCYGKLVGRPLGRLLSENPAEKVNAFAGSLFKSRGRIATQVEEAKARGLLGAKVKVGFGIEKDSSLLAEVRNAWPDGMLVADANGSYDAETAAKACLAFKGADLAWFEEPVLSDDLEGYAMLRGLGVKIGAGETWFVNDFEGPMAGRLIQVLEPSVSRCGGIGVESKVARRAAQLGIRFSPMTGMNSALSLAASLQVASANPCVAIEFNPFSNPLQTDLVEDPPEPRGGVIHVPMGPGLGVTVDRRFVKAHAG
jgi:L-alanine-DL-glutamate epimerase-like enolase superfamily enzyme